MGAPNYSCSITLLYKCGYIHYAIIDGNPIVRVQVDKFAYVIYAKSIKSAKLIISRHYRKLNKST